MITALHHAGIPVTCHCGADVELQTLDRHIDSFMQGDWACPILRFTPVPMPTPLHLHGCEGRHYVKQMLTLTDTCSDCLEADAEIDIARTSAVNAAQEAHG